jgi:hypothetical protein
MVRDENAPMYLIHIGPHKTGTTYLQAAFQAMRSTLLERGILYPELWQGADKLGHHRLAQRLRTKADEGLIGEFTSLNGKRYDTILISAEDLADLGTDSIAYFKSLLGGAEARVIFYCRRWGELLPSGWQEMIKHGHTITFPEFLSEHAVNSFGSHVINFGHTLARYVEQFGLPHISLVSYSNIVDSGRDLFTHFCQEFLSWDNALVPQHGKVNISLDPVEVEIIRALNAIELSCGSEKSNVIFRGFQQSKNKFDLSNLIAAIKNNMGHARINEGLGPLQYLHSELFRQFGQLLVEPRTGPRLFVPKLLEVPYARQDYLLFGGNAAIIQDVHRKVHDAVG